MKILWLEGGNFDVSPKVVDVFRGYLRNMNYANICTAGKILHSQ